MQKIVRQFAIASALCLTIAALVLGFFYRQAAVSQLIAQKVSENTVLAQMLADNLWEEYGPYMFELEGLDPQVLKLHPVVTDFSSVVRARASNLRVLQLSIYSLTGNTIFATDSHLLGKNVSDTANFVQAKFGHTSAKLQHELVSKPASPLMPNQDVIINVLPVYDKGTDEVAAVFEIHTIVNAMANAASDQDDAYLAIAGTLFGVFMVLLYIVRRADRAIKQHASHLDNRRQQFEYQIYHDVHTGLPNHSQFRENLQHAIPVAHQNNRLLAVLVVNLDRFKQLNHAFEPHIGDGLLHQAVERLKGCLRDCDTLARSGGDEFYILLEAITVLDEVEQIANVILEEFASSVVVQDHELYVNPSIGIAIYPFADDDVDSLIKKANTAMYFAKEAGRNSFKLYTPAMLRQTASRFSKESALRGALEREEFELHYQPVIQLKSGKIVAVEALLRWRSPELGLVSPLEFVPILEESGLITPVGQWVLETASAQMVDWKQQGITDIKVNVNISARQFEQKCISKQVRNALDHSGLNPHLLDLEITESLLIDDIGKSMQLLDVLNDMGVSLSIDDFGTGYSSLSYLKRMPIETLKVDRSFVRDISEDANDAAIVDAICALSNSMRFKVTAEGVEQQAQLDILQRMGVDAVQGFFFSKPLPVDDITEFLRQKRSLLSQQNAVA